MEDQSIRAQDCAAFKPVDKWGLGNSVEGLWRGDAKRKGQKKEKKKKKRQRKN